MSDLLEQAASTLRDNDEKILHAQKCLGFELRPLLWEDLSPHVAKAERDEVRSILGIGQLGKNQV